MLPEKPKNVQIEKVCRSCKVAYAIRAPIDGYMRYCKGANIQLALPSLTADERELLISGMCGKCYDLMCDEVATLDKPESEAEIG